MLKKNNSSGSSIIHTKVFSPAGNLRKIIFNSPIFYHNTVITWNRWVLLAPSTVLLPNLLPVLDCVAITAGHRKYTDSLFQSDHSFFALFFFLQETIITEHISILQLSADCFFHQSFYFFLPSPSFKLTTLCLPRPVCLLFYCWPHTFAYPVPWNVFKNP